MVRVAMLILLMMLALLGGCGGGASGGEMEPGITVVPMVSGNGLALGVIKDASGVPLGVRVTWQRVTDSTADGYWVYRADTATDLPDGDPNGYSSYRANGTIIAQPGSGATVVYDDTGFSPVIGEDYYYRVTVENTSGDESDFSNQLGITIATHTITAVTTTPVGIGDQVTIDGTHFGGSQSGDKVYFTDSSGSTTVEAASYVSWGDTQIVVTVPYGAADGVVGVEVGTSTVYSTQSIDYKEPAISGSPSPDEDWVQHNTITITGTDFGPSQAGSGTNSAVYFGSTPTQTADVVGWTTTQIQVLVPAAATGDAVTLTVNVAGNVSNGVSFTLLPHIDSLDVSSGTPGTSLTLTGTNFGATQGTGTVTINGTTASASSWGNTSVTVTVPAAAVDGDVVLTRDDSKTTNGGGFDVIPTISGFSFTRREIGEDLIINGAGFGSSQGTSTVTFNGGSVLVSTYNAWGFNAVDVEVPAGSVRGTVTVEVDDTDTGGLTQDSATSSGEVVIILPPPTIDDVGQL